MSDSTLKPEQLEVIRLFWVEGLNHGDAAEKAGVSRSSIYNWKQSDPAFAAEWRQCEETAKARGREALTALVDKAVGKVAEIAFHPYGGAQAATASVRLKACQDILDRIGLAKVTRTEQTGKDGGAMKHEHEHSERVDLSALSDDELEAYGRIAAKLGGISE